MEIVWERLKKTFVCKPSLTDGKELWDLVPYVLNKPFETEYNRAGEQGAVLEVLRVPLGAGEGALRSGHPSLYGRGPPLQLRHQRMRAQVDR